MDIHSKPGYDPVELFFDPVTQKILLKPELIKGSHGRKAKSMEEMAVCILDENIASRLKTLPQLVESRQLAPTMAELLGLQADFPAASII